MASEIGSKIAELEQDLVTNGSAYDYFQAVRLIGLLSKASSHSEGDRVDYNIKISPKLSFDYPSSDISDIKVVNKDDSKEYRLSTTFMGLYGVSSPLPAYFTEELLDYEWSEISAPKEFIDVLHQHLYPLLYKAWLKYKFSYNAIENNNKAYWDLLFSLTGAGTADILPDTFNTSKLIRYIGLLTYQSKSVVGLHTILQDYLGDYPVDITSCAQRNVAIPHSQRVKVGSTNCTLGEDAVLGTTIADRAGKFIVTIGPIDEAQFMRLTSDPSYLDFIRQIIKLYMAQPLEYDLIIKLVRDASIGISLGQFNWSRLGLDSWLGSSQVGDGDTISILMA